MEGAMAEAEEIAGELLGGGKLVMNGWIGPRKSGRICSICVPAVGAR
jgi:hypothetical protein